jgi:hypothetical protein
VTAAAHVLSLVRAHYSGDETAFASAATFLARAAKQNSIRHQISQLIQQGRRQPARPGQGFQQLRPPEPKAEGMLQPITPMSFAELVLPPELQAQLDEMAIELEYRDALAERKVRARNRLLFHGPAGNGKCLQIGTPVLRFDGRIVPVEEVRTGDLLMGPDSTPRRVLGTTRGRGPLYRVHPVKGDPWVCNDVHVLTLVHSVYNRVSDIDLQSYLRASNDFKHHAKLFTPEGGIDFPPAGELPIDPYFLGVWYGDGTKARSVAGELASVSVSKPDAEIRQLMVQMAQRYGAKLREHISSTGCPTFTISMGNNGGVKKNELLHQLRALFGVGEAFPLSYLTASRAERAQFLAGLLDTDGTDNCGGFEIVQKVRGFADGIEFLARSLGLRATTRPKVVNGETYWRVILSGECSTLPLRIERKRAAPRQQKKRVNRTGFTVEPAGEGEYAGFELDGDGRFLLGDFTVTHNTSCAGALANALGLRAYCVSLSRTISKYLGETGQNLGKIFDSINPGSFVVLDEIDAVAAHRGSVEHAAGKEFNSVVNTLLTLFDNNRTGIIVATTNRPDIIDPALLRRFDERLYFPAPSTEQMRGLAGKLAEDYGIEPPDVTDCANYDEVHKRTETHARREIMREILAAEAAEDEDEDGDEEETD